MEVKFADTFMESLDRLIKSERWYNKAWQWIRRDVPHFWKNVWKFRDALSRHHWWDYHGTLKFMEIAINDIAVNVETKGLEVDESRLKKVAAMKRVVEILKNVNEDRYIEMAEAELGEIIHHPWEFEDVPDKPGYSQLVDKETPAEKRHNSKVYNLSRKLEESEWKELFELLHGQNYKKFNTLFKKHKKAGMKDDRDLWNDWFDGSGLKGWWD